MDSQISDSRYAVAALGNMSVCARVWEIDLIKKGHRRDVNNVEKLCFVDSNLDFDLNYCLITKIKRFLILI